jgi:hypothetical protein
VVKAVTAALRRMASSKGVAAKQKDYFHLICLQYSWPRTRLDVAWLKLLSPHLLAFPNFPY